MAKKEEEARIVTLQELKDILFKNAVDEMRGYMHAISIMSEERAEIQRQRYVSLFQVIDNAELNKEYKRYKEKIEKK